MTVWRAHLRENFSQSGCLPASPFKSDIWLLNASRKCLISNSQHVWENKKAVRKRSIGVRNNSCCCLYSLFTLSFMNEVAKNKCCLTLCSEPKAFLERSRKAREPLLVQDEYKTVCPLKVDYCFLLVQPVVWLTDNKAGVQTRQPLWGEDLSRTINLLQRDGRAGLFP